MDAVPATGMIEEDPFFDLAGIHLAVLAEMDGSLREAVGLPASVQAVHVGLVFVRADVRVKEWRVDEATKRTHKENKGKHSRIADPAQFPALSPSSESAFERPSKQGEENHDDHGEVENVFGNVVKNV